jgi:hypothetical protein
VLERGRLVLSGSTEELLAASVGRPMRLTVADGLDVARAVLARHGSVRDSLDLDELTLLFRFDGDPGAQAALLADLVASGVRVVHLAPAVEEAEAELAQLVRGAP